MKEDILEDVSSRFWAARRTTHLNKPNESEKAYRTLAEYCRENNLFAEARIADGAIYEMKEQYEEAIWCLEHTVKDVSNNLKGIAYFFLGSVYRENSDLVENHAQQKAISCYLEAINDKRFDKEYWAKNNLANIFFSLGDLDEAEKLYLECLNSKDGTVYITLYNLGRISLKKENFQEAIKYFHKSLELSGDDIDMKGLCFREMGTANILNKEEKNIEIRQSNAIECWKLAINKFNEFDENLNNEIGKSGKAAVAHAKIRLAQLLSQGESSLKEDEKTLLYWWPPEETSSDGYSTLEERIFSQIEAIKCDRYHQYNEKRSNIRFAGKSILGILRGWGSASPLIEDSSNACRGGGYFIKWRDKGIVIDPGLDFLHNFRANGFHMREVNAVFVSHDHTDHNSDLLAIDDIFYEMHKRSSKDKWVYQLICDEKTGEKDFLENEAGHREKKVLNFLTNTWETEINLYQGPQKLPFILHVFNVKHGDGMKAYGLRLDCVSETGQKEFSIGFTCDTQYFEELNKHLEGCSILLYHISQPTLSELFNSRETRPVHLGYRGTAKLVEECKAEINLIGEFWAGFTDMRIDLTKGLRRITDSKVILPSSIGLFIDPLSLKVECTSCRRWEDAKSIHVSAAKKKFGPLEYICSLCRLTP